MALTRNIKQPFEPWIDASCQILILGSFPSIKAVSNGFYYGNPHNRFYRVLSALLGIDFAGDGSTKREKLLRARVAVYDVIESCVITGSSDASISDVSIAPIMQLIEKYPIKHIFINGQKAGALFDQHFKNLSKMRTILPSTSPANASYDLTSLISTWGIITEYLSKY